MSKDVGQCHGDGPPTWCQLLVTKQTPGGATLPTAPDHDVDGDAELASLQASFPQFQIWREIIHDRARYVAQHLTPETHPHTVVTPDLDEVRATLSAGVRR
jgi:hypothetical protein